MVIFAEQNLIMDPPFTKLDVLSCRNLLIYLAPDLQKKLIPLFHYCLNPGAILFLGSSETIGGFTHHFEPVDDKWRLYRRRDAGVQVAPLQFPAAFVSIAASAHKEPTLPTTNANISTLVDQLILQRYSPAAVLTGDAGDILYISGRSGKYLEPVAGKANWNIFAMAREGLRYELSRAFQKAVEKKRPVTLRGATAQTDGGAQAVDVTVEAITAPESLRGLVVIVFTDVGVPTNTRLPETRKKTRTRSAVLVTLEQELLKSREELRATHEEMQASQEELKSANEELQSANEELQSRNEEMTTSREEMQSMNEELQMVNHELHAKLDELSNKSNDMKNLLDATDTATIFLDDDLTVRLFTPTAIKVFKLIPGDVGRPLTDIVSTLQYPELAVHAREVLRTLATHEEQVATQDGRWFEVRILPYRTLDNLIDGVVITFADISASKAIESSLRNTQIGLQRRIGQQDLELAKCANAYSGKAEETTDG
jgi:two-component system CheB/CheR fusion protein